MHNVQGLQCIKGGVQFSQFASPVTKMFKTKDDPIHQTKAHSTTRSPQQVEVVTGIDSRSIRDLEKVQISKLEPFPSIRSHSVLQVSLFN